MSSVWIWSKVLSPMESMCTDLARPPALTVVGPVLERAVRVEVGQRDDGAPRARGRASRCVHRAADDQIGTIVTVFPSTLVTVRFMTPPATSKLEIILSGCRRRC